MRWTTGLALFFLMSPNSSAQSEKTSSTFLTSNPTLNTAIYKKALEILKPVFNIYQLKSLQINVEQEVFLSSIKTTIKSKGALNIKGEKFNLKLNGTPPSLLLFDGKFIWYQADTTEKLVFLLKNPLHIQILTHFFSENSFLKNFQIQQIKSKPPTYIFQIQPKTKIEGLSKIFMKVNTHITELRLIWKDLDNWQKYKFSKPKYKLIPDQRFQFSSSGLQVITNDPQ